MTRRGARSSTAFPSSSPSCVIAVTVNAWTDAGHHHRADVEERALTDVLKATTSAGGTVNIRPARVSAGLFEANVVFPEAGLAGTDRRWEDRRRWIQAGAIGACAAALVLGTLAWWVSSSHNRGYLAEVASQFEQVK